MNDVTTSDSGVGGAMAAARTRVPVVSVIMCVYNEASLLPGAIDSILNQSFQHLEFIIINDGSTDASQEIIQSYNDRRIVALVQENQGTVRSRNRALQIARGRYIAVQDADDVSLPERLTKQVEFLDSHQDVVLVGTGMTLIDESGRQLRDIIYPSEHSTLCRWLYEFTNPLPHSTVMFRREPVQALGGYHEVFLKAEDFALCLRLVAQYRIASIPEPLVLLRSRIGSETFGDDRAHQWKAAVLARALAVIQQRSSIDLLGSPAWPVFFGRFEKWFEASGAKKKFVAAKLRRLARLRWHQQEYLEGLRLLLYSLLEDPQWPLVFVTRSNPLWNRDTERQVLEIAKACIEIGGELQ